MSKRKLQKQPAARSAIAEASGLHVPLPAVLIGLGLLATPAVGVAGTAVDDHYSIAVNSSLSGVNVTANDSITPNASVVVYSISGPTHGYASLQTNGLLQYSPQNGFQGQDSLQYGLDNASNTFATVFINVGAVAGTAQPVPGLTPAGIAALSAAIAGLALRRRRKG